MRATATWRSYLEVCKPKIVATMLFAVLAGMYLAAPAALVSFGLLLIQLALGIANVLLGLPLAVATAHNGVAALLALSWLCLALALRPAVRS